MRLEHLTSSLEEELEFLKNLPLELWNLLGQFVNQAGSSLRGDVLQASHVALAYLDSKVLHVARRFPWCMCSGDLMENLEWLAQQSDEPDEATAKKMYRLLHMGYNRAQLVAGLKLMQQCPWSTALVEQLHGSTAAIHKAA